VLHDCTAAGQRAGLTAAAAALQPDILKKIGGHAFSQAPETMKIRLAGGGELLLRWDPAARQAVCARRCAGLI